MLKRPNNYNQYSRYLSLGAEITASMLVPIFAGYLVDSYWKTEPWGFLIGILIGLLGVFNTIYKIAKDASRKTDDE